MPEQRVAVEALLKLTGPRMSPPLHECVVLKSVLAPLWNRLRATHNTLDRSLYNAISCHTSKKIFYRRTFFRQSRFFCYAVLSSHSKGILIGKTNKNIIPNPAQNLLAFSLSVAVVVIAGSFTEKKGARTPLSSHRVFLLNCIPPHVVLFESVRERRHSSELWDILHFNDNVKKKKIAVPWTNEDECTTATAKQIWLFFPHAATAQTL